MTRDHKLALVVGFGLILFVGILVTDHLSATTQSDDLLPQNAVTSDWDQPLTLAATPRATFRDEAIGSTAPRATPIRNDARPRTAEVVIEPEISLEPEEVVVERPVPRSPERVIHVVQSGETLQEISKRYFQTVRRWKDPTIVGSARSSTREPTPSVPATRSVRSPGVNSGIPVDIPRSSDEIA